MPFWIPHYLWAWYLNWILHFKSNHKLQASAKNLLYAGCSAGGLTAYLHTEYFSSFVYRLLNECCHVCSYVASYVPKTVKVLGLADAMFSLEHNSIDNIPLFPSRMQWGFTAWNSSVRQCSRFCIILKCCNRKEFIQTVLKITGLRTGTRSPVSFYHINVFLRIIY